MTDRTQGIAESYVVQRGWRGEEGDADPEWIDYRDTSGGLDRARELFELAATRSGFEGPWRIIHRVTAVVETVVD